MEFKRRRKNTQGQVNFFALEIITFLTLLFFCPVTLHARPVGRRQAETVVRGWLKADARPLRAALGRQIKKVDTFSDDGGEPIYYVVYLQPMGFVIVPADDLVEPIICFVPVGMYDPSDDNPLGALVSRDVPGRIAAVRALQAVAGTATEKKDQDDEEAALQNASLKAQSKWSELEAYADSVGTLGLSSISDVRVAPLLQSTWDQATVNNIGGGISCYNYYTPPFTTPNGDSYNYPTGCVATAMAQLMRYHQHPTAGVGPLWFQIEVNGVSQWQSLRGGNGAGGPYVWSAMVLQPDNSITDPQRQAIGALCFDAGVSVEMSYTSSNSSASPSDAKERLKDTFDYSNAIYGWNNNGEIGAGLNGMVNPNLDASCPVAFSVRREGGGHVVVCDGYGYNASTLYHHLNMGWSGSYNAWYDLPIIDAYYTYTSVDGCIYNLFVSDSGEIISGRVVDLAGLPISGVSITASGGGTHHATTNAQGIYALVVPSNTSFTVSASKPPHAFTNRNTSTGLSSDWSSNSGNSWGVNFVSQTATPPTAQSQNVSAFSGTAETITLSASDEGYPNPPGQLSYIIASLPSHGTLTDPAASQITSVPYTLAGNGNTVNYWPCTYFAGQDSFDFKANDGGDPPEGGDSEPATVTIDVDNVVYTTFEPQTNATAPWPLGTYYHDSRTQVIYLASEIGGAKTITDLALNIQQAPGQALNNWTIRMKHTTLDAYPLPARPLFETSGWTIAFQGNEPATPIGWRNFHFQNVFEYNGTDNLLIDFSHNNSSYSSDGWCYASDGPDNNTHNFDTRVLMAFSDSAHDNPLDWTSYMVGLNLYTAEAVPNLKLISTVSAQPITGDFEPDCDVDRSDLGILASAWLSSPGDGNWNSDYNLCPPDIINFLDFCVFADHWLESLP
jgi:hypothetical protein